MNGIIVVNKEKGYTSRDVVNIISKILGTKKVGHTGTLDPIAEGVLVVCVGKCTKLCDYFTSNEKEYIALLAEFPTAQALLDVGHGHVNGWDLCRVVRTLGPRLAAFHLHDNDGESDQHVPIGTGTIDWQHVLPTIQTYAPEAVWVLEYANGEFKTAAALMRHIENVRSTFSF